MEISEEEYERLVSADRKLGALEEMGVDNWEGYSEAMALLKEDE